MEPDDAQNLLRQIELQQKRRSGFCVDVPARSCEDLYLFRYHSFFRVKLLRFRSEGFLFFYLEITRFSANGCCASEAKTFFGRLIVFP